ncbi:MAG: DPP IV N-terminal domain-containing protein [Flavobacteriales bacterium]|nr:DPP IV N-terminal domain-containing protein [Flavobacteriales bacterium]
MLRSSLFIATAGVALSLVAQKQITNQDLWTTPLYGTKGVYGLQSMNDGVHYTTLGGKDGAAQLFQCAYATGDTVGVIFNSKDLRIGEGTAPLDVQGYSFSGDEKKLMIETGMEGIYRYSYYAYNYVYDRTTKTVQPLSDVTKPKQRLATFSPDGSRAAFVRDNNIFVVDLATMAETQITKDGEWNHILNGATDWVYEEEFALVQGYQWSPDGTKILYLRTDETNVREWNVDTYANNLYPHEHRYKYPKAGEENSIVELYVCDLRGFSTTLIPLDGSQEPYIPRFGWTANDDVLWYMTMNRLQNTKTISTVSVPLLRAVQVGLKPRVVYRETSKTYVEVTDDLYFNKEGNGFVLTTEQSGWNHIWYQPMNTKIADGSIPAGRAITTGNWDVVGVKGIDEANKRVIFTASKNGATQQEVWAVGLSGKPMVQLSPKGGFNDAEFSKGFKYFINSRSTANEPDVVTLHDATGKQIKVLEDNNKLRDALKELSLSPCEFFSFTTEGGVQLNGWMMKPLQMRANTRYPTFMVQYSGPNSNEVLDKWDGRSFLWAQMLVQKGYIVACVDPRGTGRRGRDFRHQTYGQLGKYETEDQIAAAKWLGQQPYVDPARIGIFGWSYGGYMSSLCITKGADVFKCAIAVAPVTNWRYYDSIYTERYMGLPKDNGSGYDDNSPINHVGKLKGKYLLIHGLADDNVHYQNTADMVTALVKAGKPFEQFIYPDKNHGIGGGGTRLHLYEMINGFLDKNL